jgi:YD repeat-containing protein
MPRLHALIGPLVALLSIEARASESTIYTYDAQGRLVQQLTSGTSINSGLDIRYTLDPSGNRIAYIVAGSKNQGQQVVVLPVGGLKVIPINP